MLTLMIAIADLSASLVQPPIGSLIRPDRACYTISMTQGGETRPVGLAWQTIERKEENGRKVIRVNVHQRVGSFDMRDDFVLAAEDLRPIRFINTRNEAQHLVLRYEENRVVGERKGADGVPRIVEARSARPVWEGNLFGVTFAALPLKQGASFRLPFYQYDKGFGEFTLRVKGVEMVDTPAGREQAWVLDAGISPAERLEYLIGRHTRRELGYRHSKGSQLLGGDCSALSGDARPAAPARMQLDAPGG